MKKMILSLLVLGMANTLLAQNDEKQAPFQVKPLTGETVKDIEVETSGGNISVENIAGQQSRVEVYIWPSNRNKNANVSKEEIQKRLDEYYDLKIGVVNNKLSAIAKSKSGRWDSKTALSISFKIYVPGNVSTDLTTSGGNIRLTDLSGSQKITTSGGNLVINKVKGKLKGITSGGNIDVADSHDNIELVTSGGNVDAKNCTGDLKLVTSGGNIDLHDLNGNIEATTSGGDVDANEIGGDLEAHTSGGNIDLLNLSCNVTTATSGGNIKVVMKDPKSFVKIHNSAGSISLQLPSGKGYDLDLNADKIKTDNLANFSGKTTDDEINGKLNGGGTKVTLDAGSGRINLTLK